MAFLEQIRASTFCLEEKKLSEIKLQPFYNEYRVRTYEYGKITMLIIITVCIPTGLNSCLCRGKEKCTSVVAILIANFISEIQQPNRVEIKLKQIWARLPY